MYNEFIILQDVFGIIYKLP